MINTEERNEQQVLEDRLIEVGPGTQRPLILWFVDLIQQAKKRFSQDIQRRAQFIKFEAQMKEGKYWNVFILTNQHFGKRCSASLGRSIIYLHRSQFYMIWHVKINKPQ